MKKIKGQKIWYEINLIQKSKEYQGEELTKRLEKEYVAVDDMLKKLEVLYFDDTLNENDIYELMQQLK